MNAFPCILQQQGQAGPGAPPTSQWFNRSIGRGFRGAQHRHPRAVMKTHEHRVVVGTAFAGVSRAIIAGIWVAFFQRVPAIIARAGGAAGGAGGEVGGESLGAGVRD